MSVEARHRIVGRQKEEQNSLVTTQRGGYEIVRQKARISSHAAASDASPERTRRST